MRDPSAYLTAQESNVVMVGARTIQIRVVLVPGGSTATGASVLEVVVNQTVRERSVATAGVWTYRMRAGYVG